MQRQPREQEIVKLQGSGSEADDDWKRQEARNLALHLPSDRTHALEIMAYMVAEILARD